MPIGPDIVLAGQRQANRKAASSYSMAGDCREIPASCYRVAPPGDVGHALRTDMLGVNFPGANGAAVSGMERLGFAPADEGNLPRSP